MSAHLAFSWNQEKPHGTHYRTKNLIKYLRSCFSHITEKSSESQLQRALKQQRDKTIFHLWNRPDSSAALIPNPPVISSITHLWVQTRLPLCPATQEEKEVSNLLNYIQIATPWTEKPGGLQSMGRKRVGPDWATNTHPLFSCMSVLSPSVVSNSFATHGL